MNHGTSEYHSRGYETHKYVYSRLTAYNHLPLPCLSAGQLASMHCYRHPHLHHTISCHPVYHSPHLLTGSFFHGQSAKKNKGRLKGLPVLDREIPSFCKGLEPTNQTDVVRERVVDRIRNAVEGCISPVQVEVFGSFKTGLYLPSSDIDIVVFHDRQSTPFDILKEALISGQVCDEDKITVLYNATVPIIKLTDKQTDIKVDIGFNIHNAPKSAVFIQRSMSEWPHMRELLIVLKQLLIEQDLNEVYSGGISSYSLTLLILCFLKLSSKNVARQGCGMLLMEFLRYYGYYFDYRFFGIGVNPPCLFQKSTPSDALFIQDPLCPSNDVARGSYKFNLVQAAFKTAFSTLVSMQPGNFLPSCPQSPDQSVLGSIIMMSRPVERHSSDPAYYDQCGSDGGFSVFSSDESATPSSSNVEFEVVSLPGTDHPRPAESVDSNPSSSSASEAAIISDEEVDCNDRYPGPESHSAESRDPRLRLLNESAGDGRDAPVDPPSVAAEFVGRFLGTGSPVGNVPPQQVKPSYRDVVRSVASQSFVGKDQRNCDLKSHSCSDVSLNRSRMESSRGCSYVVSSARYNQIKKQIKAPS